MDTLFFDGDGRAFSAEDIFQVLKDVGADECEFLFIHSDVMFGRPAAGFRRREYLGTLYQIVESLGVKHILVPTFTYSFCNNEDYDVLKSKTAMGAFSEYVRNLDGRYRTLDPLLSISVPGALRSTFEKIGNQSLGTDSGLDKLHHLDGVKFLFLGAEMADCFTYLHYVERMAEVPYRFEMEFEGRVTDYDGSSVLRRQSIYTHCKGVKLPQKYDYFEEELFERGVLKKKRLGDKAVACLSEKDAWREITEKLAAGPDYFLTEPFSAEKAIHEYTYDATKGRITHC